MTKVKGPTMEPPIKECEVCHKQYGRRRRADGYLIPVSVQEASHTCSPECNRIWQQQDAARRAAVKREEKRRQLVESPKHMNDFLYRNAIR